MCQLKDERMLTRVRLRTDACLFQILTRKPLGPGISKSFAIKIRALLTKGTYTITPASLARAMTAAAAESKSQRRCLGLDRPRPAGSPVG
jgi:hypothetical protein